MFKKIRISLLCIVFLTSNVGFAFNVHICGGLVSEISAIWNKAGCDMSDDHKNDFQKHSKNFKVKDCCSDEILIIQTSDLERISAKQIDKLSDDFSIFLSNTLFIGDTFFVNLNLEKIKYPPPVKLFLLFSSFIFYG